MNAESWRRRKAPAAPETDADGFGREVASTFHSGWLKRSRRHVLIMTAVIAIAIVAGSLIRIDIFATALGQVAPNSYTRAVDAPRTGYVRRLLVANGQSVRVGQPILVFDCAPEQAQREAAASQVAQLQEQLDSHTLLGRNIVPGFRDAPSSAPSRRPRNEAALRTSLFEEAKASAEQAVRRAEARVSGAEAKLTSARADRQLKQSSFGRLAALNERGFATRAALDQQAAELQQSVSNVDVALAELGDAREAVRQLRADAARTTLDSQSRTLEAVSTTRADLLKQRTEVAALDTGLNNCTVHAPATGQLFWLNSLTPGTWVRSDEPLSKVVPQNQPMIVQAVLQDQDIPFVHVGQRAVVKLNSLPFVRYGTLSGHVRFVSPDAVTDKAGQTAYRMEIEVTSMPAEARRTLPSLISGMDVEVNVVTDNRRLIEYFFDPILVAIRNSFHER